MQKIKTDSLNGLIPKNHISQIALKIVFYHILYRLTIMLTKVTNAQVLLIKGSSRYIKKLDSLRKEKKESREDWRKGPTTTYLNRLSRQRQVSSTGDLLVYPTKRSKHFRLKSIQLKLIRKILSRWLWHFSIKQTLIKISAN